ncbi:MAG: DHH family phosphoesterase [Nanoarchaeota archaeon]|nr:DHH family phosphoesterase [Nanoarchaeota archaeon]
MQQIDFTVGDERRFFDFIKRLDGSRKIALISHTDLDGIACAKIMNEVVNADFLIFVNYSDINGDLIEELKKKEVTKVIFTDLNINRADLVKKIEDFAEILIIDHHIFEVDFNSDKTIFLNTTGKGFSAGYVCYYLLSQIKDIDKYDWLIACSSLADWCYKENSSWMREVYGRYSEEFNAEDPRRGKFWDAAYSISLALIYFEGKEKEIYEMLTDKLEDVDKLKTFAQKVKGDIKKCIEDFKEKKEIFNERYFFEFKSQFSIKSLAINEISTEHPDKTIFVIECNENNCAVSARRQDGNENLPELLNKLVDGFENSDAGGHFKAAGANFPKEYYAEFKRRIKNL